MVGVGGQAALHLVDHQGALRQAGDHHLVTVGLLDCREHVGCVDGDGTVGAGSAGTAVSVAASVAAATASVSFMGIPLTSADYGLRGDPVE